MTILDLNRNIRDSKIIFKIETTLIPLNMNSCEFQIDPIIELLLIEDMYVRR